MNTLYSKFTPKEKCKLTFSVDIFLSLMASSSIGWSSFWSNIHPLLLFWPISSSVPILEAIFQLFFFFFFPNMKLTLLVLSQLTHNMHVQYVPISQSQFSYSTFFSIFVREQTSLLLLLMYGWQCFKPSVLGLFNKEMLKLLTYPKKKKKKLY